MKIVKGKLVRLNVGKCFTAPRDGRLRAPYESGIADREGWIYGIRSTTREEQEAQLRAMGVSYNSLPVQIYRDRIYTVLRGRCTGSEGNFMTGAGVHRHRMILVLDTESGHEVYVKKALMELVR